jgi:antitoxin (DNA-binding transcriptional repressor) of toxin-antitoxin stability system
MHSKFLSECHWPPDYGNWKSVYNRYNNWSKEVKQGQRYTIILRGVPVADLVSSKSAASHEVKMAIERMQSIEKIQGISNELLQALITEGRR